MVLLPCMPVFSSVLQIFKLQECVAFRSHCIPQHTGHWFFSSPAAVIGKRHDVSCSMTAAGESRSHFIAVDVCEKKCSSPRHRHMTQSGLAEVSQLTHFLTRNKYMKIGCHLLHNNPAAVFTPEVDQDHGDLGKHNQTCCEHNISAAPQGNPF